MNPPSDEDSSDEEVVQVSVPEEEVGVRLDVFLAKRFPEHSRVRLRQIINAAEARVNDERRKAAYHLRAGDVISIRFPPVQHESPQPEDIPLDVLFEDDQIAVINKPHGMVVHPSKGHWQGTLTAALAFHFEQLSQIGGSTRPGIVHRLDRDTSGVIVVAKNDESHLKLSRQFEQRTVQKQYFAVGRGTVDRDRDQISAPIGMHPYQREKMAIRDGHSTSREAETFFEVVQRYRGFTVFRVFPKTGRTHQIRVHLAHIGCAVACDPLYSGHRVITEGELQTGRPGGEVVLGRLALHAQRISIDHPVTGERVEFEAPLPDDLTRFVERLAR